MKMATYNSSWPQTGTRVYPVSPARPRPALRDRWADAAWRGVPGLAIDCFRPESSAHRPRTRVKLVRGDRSLYGLFQVADRYIRSIHTGFQAPVYRDSCVEFFVQPRPDRGYFNFEFNCGGAVLASYITDPTRTADGFKGFRPLTPADGRLIRVGTSLPAVVDPEIAAPRTWYLAFQIPFDLLARYAGTFPVGEGAIWGANFYKCGDDTSHPHWAAWSPVDALNFHRPHCFGRLRFCRRPGQGDNRGEGEAPSEESRP
jgi:hypothetical protein